MRTVIVEELTVESFSPFGAYADMLNPSGEYLGSRPIEFYRDMIQQSMSTETVSYSVCRVSPRELVIDTSEYHNNSAELCLPLDGDVLMHVGPATNGPVPLDRIRVFRVKKGTAVVIRKGIWHHAAYALATEPVNILIALPERTYATDCYVSSIKDCDKISIVHNEGGPTNY